MYLVASRPPRTSSARSTVVISSSTRPNESRSAATVDPNSRTVRTAMRWVCVSDSAKPNRPPRSAWVSNTKYTKYTILSIFKDERSFDQIVFVVIGSSKFDVNFNRNQLISNDFNWFQPTSNELPRTHSDGFSGGPFDKATFNLPVDLHDKVASSESHPIWSCLLSF